MDKVFVFLADGFEDVEAVTPIDYLRRVGVNLVTVGVPKKTVNSAHALSIVCDKTIDEVINEVPKMAIFPGGLSNTRTLSESEAVKTISLKTNEKGLIAGICAAPAIVFSPWGLLDGKKFTCYPGMDAELPNKAEKTKRVVVDGNLITSAGPGSAEEFAFKLVELLAGKKALTNLKKELVARA
ncbi:MAG: DJ-1/PfpI family protein [Treponemataceae bacterium]